MSANDQYLREIANLTSDQEITLPQRDQRRNFRSSATMQKREMAVNRFGHTVTNPDDGRVLPAEDLQVELISPGNPVAHGDIFSSPSMRKFMQEHNLAIGEQPDPSAEFVSPCREDQEPTACNTTPTTLEEWNSMADDIISETPALPSRFAATSRPAPMPARVEPPSPAPQKPASTNANRCTSCEGVLNAGSRFCPLCGAKQPTRFCAACGFKFQGEERFCPDCGTSR